MSQSIKDRLEYLRAERMSYDELHELQCFGVEGKIDPSDVELREAAGVPENQLVAWFQPQVGIGNEFQNAGPAVSFNVWPALVKLGEEAARKLKDNRENTDELAPPELVEAHHKLYGDEAAYYVHGVEAAVVEWFGPVGGR